MTVPTERPVAYHVGFAVADLDRVAETYRQLFNVEHWWTWEMDFPGLPSNPQTTDGRLKIAFARVGGMTLELVQCIAGRTVHAEFVERHGDGVQHIGFWVPDVQRAVEDAIDQGCRLDWAYQLPNSQAFAQISPASDPHDVVETLDPRLGAYVTPEVGGIQIEYLGPAVHERMLDRYGDRYRSVADPPPWADLPSADYQPEHGHAHRPGAGNHRH